MQSPQGPHSMQGAHHLQESQSNKEPESSRPVLMVPIVGASRRQMLPQSRWLVWGGGLPQLSPQGRFEGVGSCRATECMSPGRLRP